MKKLYLFFPITVIPIIISFWFVEAGQNQWTQSLQNASISNDCIAINSQNQQLMYAATTANGIYKSTDGGNTWAQIYAGLNFVAFAISNSNPNIFYGGTSATGMYKSTDACLTWTQINNGITESTSSVQAIDIKPNDPNTVVICIFNGTTDANPGVYKTTNGGTIWTGSTSGMGPMKNFLSMTCNPANPNTIYIGSSFSSTNSLGIHLYKSYNFGSTWVHSDNGIDTTLNGTDVIRSLSYSTIDTVTILAGRFWNTTNGGPWLTTNAGLNWVQRAGGIPATAPGSLIRSIKIRPGSNTEFYLGGDFSNSFPPGGVWRTTNAGLNWFDFNSGVMNQNNAVRALNFRAISGDSTLFAGVSAGTIGVYNFSFVTVSQAFCEGFNSTTFPPSGWSIAYTGTNYWSRQTFSGFGLGQGCADFDNYDAPSGTIQSLVTPVFTPTGTNDSLCYDIAYCSWSSYPDDSLIILTSSNGGATYNSFFRLGELQMGTVTNCSHPYTPSATDWNRRKYHLPAATNRIAIQAISGYGDHLYLDSICICNLVGIRNPLNDVPKVYSLSQNYPNPFNPVTTIEYQLPKAGLVKLVVYDILGKEVQLPVNRTQPAGSYKIEWNGANFPSGVYFYKIQSGDFIETKKMVLLK